jgi:hypothetical protein
MSFLTVHVEGIGGYDADNFSVVYSFTAVPDQAENAVSSSGTAIFPVATLSSVVNSSLITTCVSQALDLGVTIGLSDRKILAGGLI